ncbi:MULTISPECIES: hypothetical protein [Pelosinus]|nr:MULTISPECIES: hypothetical protein [Pelosinus]
MKGQQITSGAKLVPYNTKLMPETKELLGVIAQVQKLDGQRELIERMLVVYGEKYPDSLKAAKDLINMLGDLKRPEDPINS